MNTTHGIKFIKVVLDITETGSVVMKELIAGHILKLIQSLYKILY
jgi:hypothetical protein